MRKAKIVCTLGPASDTPAVLEAMVGAGLDVARINFSHGTYADHERRIARVRRAARKVGRTVAILQDVQGPKIRVGAFREGRAQVSTGDEVTVTTRAVLGTDRLIPTPVRSLPGDVKRGDPILLDDGRVRLQVLRVRGSDVLCRAERGGSLSDHKGINLPGCLVSVPTLTRKDLQDLAFGRRVGVDYVALSFVRSAQDIRRARRAVAAGVPLIAKIEKPQAVDAIESIAEEADGLMVARGDLGVEVPLERLPGIQKHLVAVGNRHGNSVIVATEMLESMIGSARPTRAEVSDVANAIGDGADAVMLSGETAVGKYPVEATETMARVVAEAEASLEVRHARPSARSQEVSFGVAAAAVAAAAQLEVGLVVAYTWSGYTARLLSSLRPRSRILALTPHPGVVRRMALCWGVTARQVGELQSTDAMLRQVRRLCREERLAPPGTPVVIVAGVPLNIPGNTNLMTVHTV